MKYTNPHLHIVLVTCSIFLCISSYCTQYTNAYQSITDFGALADENSNSAAAINSHALGKALYAANASSTDRVAYVPAGSSFYIFMTNASNLYNVTLRVDGTLIVSNNLTAFPTQHDHSSTLHITDSAFVTIEGYGTWDGQGYDWWWDVILNGKDQRPNLLGMERVTNVLVHQIHFKNAPQYHVNLRDMRDVVIRNMSVDVDVYKQKALLSQHGLLSESGLPIFPLNTDGVDYSGINALIENCTIRNFDDAIAIKPSNGGLKYSSCSSNITMRNLDIHWSVGATIGSVPPHPDVNCVRNVTFENITFHNALKAIYIKTNPGTVGSGIIDSITYRNMTVYGSWWYPIWIGPQQQKQPDSKGTGCSFLYPLVDKCPTQPRVPISNILLEDITLTDGLFWPGVILCDPTRPCTNIQFNNVTNTGTFLVRKDYACHNVEGSSSGSSPVPSCFH
jgi:polygalacturonase